LEIETRDKCVLLQLVDNGPPVPQAWRMTALTLEGQVGLRAAGNGRYGRMLNLLAARALAHAMNLTLELTDRDGHHVVRIQVPLSE